MNLLGLLRRRKATPDSLLTSRLFNERNFYYSFMNDLKRCTDEVIIESPFVTSSRMAKLLPVLRQLRRHGVKITVNTRDPSEHQFPWSYQAREAIRELQQMGVRVLYTGGHHRKLAMLDGRILWEGSLNILSNNGTCEVMRRIESKELAEQMVRFLGLKNSWL
ncbi:MAG TPA: phospholipase D-like domain-containing protein [Magnetospirillaceae bacterium]|nr:phospholipase D-like domain-containing protein [Magnetospirillaceae bacterium]